MGHLSGQTRDFSVTVDNVELRLSVSEHNKIHCHRKGETTEGGHENNGPFELVALDQLVFAHYALVYHFHIPDDDRV